MSRPQVQFIIEQYRFAQTGKSKWKLSIKTELADFVLGKVDPIGFELVQEYTYLHHAKARMLKMASAYSSYHYIIVNKCNEIVEQETVGIEETEVSEIASSSSPLFQKVVYRIIKYTPNFYALDFQCWLSAAKETSNTHAYDHQNLGEFPTYTQALNFLSRHASKYPAYTIVSAGVKERSQSLTVYESQDFFKSQQQDLWFEEIEQEQAIANNGNALADVVGNGVADEATPPSNTGGLKSEESEANDCEASKSSGISTQSETKDWEQRFNQLFPEYEEELKKMQISEAYAQQVFENGSLKTIMLRRGINSPAFIDTLSFVLSESAFSRLNDDGQPISSLEATANAIHEVRQIMGLDIVPKELGGRNGYTECLQFGDKEQNRNYGFVAYGGEGQKETIMFHFTGEGLSVARDCWEINLYRFLESLASAAKITRVDISHDFLFGDYTLDQAVQDWKNDCYTVRQVRPQAECMGSDWLSDTKKGRTFYIGSKKSSRILYFYEKGKQLGDENSNWVRLELRQRNKDYIIPKDVLLYSGDYLCTAYPHIAKILDYDFSEQYRFQRIKKENGVAIGHVVKYAKMQVSPAIQMLKMLGLNSDEIVTELLNRDAKIPKRVVLNEHDIAELHHEVSKKGRKKKSEL